MAVYLDITFHCQHQLYWYWWHTIHIRSIEVYLTASHKIRDANGTNTKYLDLRYSVPFRSVPFFFLLSVVVFVSLCFVLKLNQIYLLGNRILYSSNIEFIALERIKCLSVRKFIARPFPVINLVACILCGFQRKNSTATTTKRFICAKSKDQRIKAIHAKAAYTFDCFRCVIPVIATEKFHFHLIRFLFRIYLCVASMSHTSMTAAIHTFPLFANHEKSFHQVLFNKRFSFSFLLTMCELLVLRVFKKLKCVQHCTM